MKAFSNVYDLLTSGIDHSHILEANYQGCFAWDITSTIRLIVRISNNNDSNLLQISKQIEEVTIEGVIDYHDRKNKWLIH